MLTAPMWFPKAKPPQATQPEPIQASADEDRRKYRDLEAQVRQIAEATSALQAVVKEHEKGLKTLELDWQEWFDKFRLLYVRLSKRIKDWQAVNPDQDGDKGPQQPAGATNAPHVGYGHPPMPPHVGGRRGNY